MKVAQSGKNFFRELEGLELWVYPDSGGALTIGIGHLLTRSERLSGKISIGKAVGDYREGLTEQQCWDLLDQDLEQAEKTVNESVFVPLSQNQFDALVSFAFNVGRQAFLDSTLLKLLNRGHYDQVPAQLARWVYDNGKNVAGLGKRRKKETALWLQPDRAAIT